jgi:hypothetical protein
MADANVWTVLLRRYPDAVDIANRVVAAAIGADTDPTVLTAELREAADLVLAGGDDEIGPRLIALVTAFAGISRGLTSAFGSVVADVKDESGEGGSDDARNAELHFLEVAVQSLRDTFDPGDR